MFDIEIDLIKSIGAKLRLMTIKLIDVISSIPNMTLKQLFILAFKSALIIVPVLLLGLVRSGPVITHSIIKSATDAQINRAIQTQSENSIAGRSPFYWQCMKDFSSPEKSIPLDKSKQYCICFDSVISKMRQQGYLRQIEKGEISDADGVFLMRRFESECAALPIPTK